MSYIFDWSASLLLLLSFCGIGFVGNAEPEQPAAAKPLTGIANDQELEKDQRSEKDQPSGGRQDTTDDIGGTTNDLDPRPNIIILKLDDADFDLLESGLAYNGGAPIFPNLEDFRRRSIRFANFHNSTPLCGPSRSCMLTGQYAWKTRVKVNQPTQEAGQGFTGGYDQFQNYGPFGIYRQGNNNYYGRYQNQNLAKWLEIAGYTNIQVGKYVHSGFPATGHTPPGWHEFMSPATALYYNVNRTVVADGVHQGSQNINDLNLPDYPLQIQQQVLNLPALGIDVDNAPFGDFPGPGDIDNNGNNVLDAGHKELLYRTRVETADLIRHLNDNRPGGNPGGPVFALYTPLCAHKESSGASCENPEGFSDSDGDGLHDPCGMVDIDQVGNFTWVSLPPAPDWNEDPVTDKTSHIRLLPLLNADELAEQNIAYRNRVRCMKTFDNMLGYLMGWLRAHEDYQTNTYVMLTSDNGYQLGHHRLTAKQINYQRNTNVPLYVMGPDLTFDPGAAIDYYSVDHLTAQIDITPTCLELAEAPIRPQIDGKSFVPVLDRGLPPDPANWRPEGLLIENFSRKAVRRTDEMAHQNLYPGSNSSNLEYSFEAAYTALRFNDIVYTMWANGEREFYNINLVNDPWQLNNTFSSLTKNQIDFFENTLRQIKQELPAPIATIKTPLVDGEDYDNGVVIEGFAEDDLGIGEVRLVIQDLSTGPKRYWNGSEWVQQNAAIQVQAQVTNPGDPLVRWRYDFHPPDTSAVTCKVSARAYDVNGQHPGNSGLLNREPQRFLAFRTFVVNSETNVTQFAGFDELTANLRPPTGATLVPLNRRVVGTGTPGNPSDHLIRGWAEDSDGIVAVQLEIRRHVTPSTYEYWNGSFWQSQSNLVLANSSSGSLVEWDYDFQPPHAVAEDLRIRAYAMDSLGNENESVLLKVSRRNND